MIILLIIVLGIAVMLVCMIAPDRTSTSKHVANNTISTGHQAVTGSPQAKALVQKPLPQAAATNRVLSGSNEDLAYIFGSMVAALGATGYIQIGGNGIVHFCVGNFGVNWATCKTDLPQNVYKIISSSNVLTDKVVAGIRVMKYEPQGRASCSLSSPEKWAEDANWYFDIFKREMEQGYADTNKQKRTLSFNLEITPASQNAVLWVGKNDAGGDTNISKGTDSKTERNKLDQSIVDKIMLFESVAIALASSKRSNGNNINHGFIRCTADDFNGKSYVSFYGSVFNVLSNQEYRTAFKELLTNKTLSSCTNYLAMIGATTVSPKRFLEFIQHTTIAENPTSAGEGFTAKYDVSVPDGMGCVYHDVLLRKLKESYPYFHFECEYGEIDLSI